jgi:hypothetical protein
MSLSGTFKQHLAALAEVVADYLLLLLHAADDFRTPTRSLISGLSFTAFNVHSYASFVNTRKFGGSGMLQM